MAKFIRTNVRSAVNPVHIVEVDDYDRAHLTNGEQRTLSESYWEGSPVIVPAEAGFTLLRFYYGDNDPSLDKVRKWMERLPIIAWKCEGFCVEPITPVTSEDEATNKIGAVQLPDGQVVADRSYYRLMTPEEWIEEVHNLWHERIRDEWEDGRSERFLRRQLASGPKSRDQLERAAERNGYRAYPRLLHDIGAKEDDGMWSLPEKRRRAA